MTEKEEIEEVKVLVEEVVQELSSCSGLALLFCRRPGKVLRSISFYGIVLSFGADTSLICPAPKLGALST